RFHEADEQRRRLLQLQPDHPEGLRIHGQVLLALRRTAEANAACRRAVELAPGSAAVNSTLGFILLEQGATQEALGLLRRAFELDPTDSVAHSNMLFCLAHSADADPQSLVDQHRAFGLRYGNRKRAAAFTTTRDPARQ
ncbi:tetratricopeptide repeat protein, partial [Priestia megaterium]|uniref:tetratricopeptide repeat protein n=1 Tax=Priestia megaterium TaxID=1404 RepID=UPI00203E14FF